jgi:hypothetical protein
MIEKRKDRKRTADGLENFPLRLQFLVGINVETLLQGKENEIKCLFMCRNTGKMRLQVVGNLVAST